MVSIRIMVHAITTATDVTASDVSSLCWIDSISNAIIHTSLLCRGLASKNRSLATGLHAGNVRLVTHQSDAAPHRLPLPPLLCNLISDSLPRSRTTQIVDSLTMSCVHTYTIACRPNCVYTQPCAGSIHVEDVYDTRPHHEHYHPQHDDASVDVNICMSRFYKS